MNGSTRIGFGVDAHRFGEQRPLVLGGVIVDEDRGLEATTDGDVAVHALIDALLGASALGDIGTHFPPGDGRWSGSSSLDLLAITRDMVRDRGYFVVNVDVTVVAQTGHVSPHRAQMQARIAETLQVDIDAVSVKATTTDHLGFTGRDEGIAAMAVASLEGKRA